MYFYYFIKKTLTYFFITFPNSSVVINRQKESYTSSGIMQVDLVIIVKVDSINNDNCKRSGGDMTWDR